MYKKINFMPKITSIHIHTVKNKESGASMNTTVNSDILSSYSKKVNYLQSFDTAFIAYQMMGLSNFD
ncbi:hypothetical protein NIES4072_41460 [Nostoc commune NIES-4072]|uniref:Uncharacterized protein n=1 Tax=Nostoc commune NIES-4072 TaxID=2005467 RepID=A0A2R5FNW9_NOSCO|nr:hypothetical protein NIES4070_49390 [Nostoc commune HK-02]GBG20467.1 hypothetical protein NIES4072_41460 [Nostoc commune NIES-4072]